MDILIIGGTRNIGYFLAQHLLDEGHRLTILNRGVTRDELPVDLPRLHADRTDLQQMRRALEGRKFDAVVDMTMFKEQEAEDIVQILDGQVGHYIFVSTGQVYLIRAGLTRPFTETDYETPIVEAPEIHTYDYEEWLYGQGKSKAEDVFARAHKASGFPYTSLRLPMVNSERDGFNRLYGYVLRLRDGGPILVPDTPDYPLRHIYSHDVVSAISTLINTGKGKGRAYNISQDETLTLDEFLDILGDVLGITPHIQRVERSVLEANGFLPDCSPYSDLWMSELDNSRSKAEFGMEYTPVRTYLEKIVAYYDQYDIPAPVSYRRRHAEKMLLTHQ